MNRLILVSFFSLLACSFTLPTGAATTEKITPASSYLVNGSAVRLRTEPATSGAEITQLAFGTPVTALAKTPNASTLAGKTAPWYQVQSTRGTGWVFGGFLEPIKANQTELAALNIIRTKLGQDTLAFKEAMEIYQWVTQAIPKSRNPNSKGELELAQLSALQLALDTIEYTQHSKEPYQTLLKAQGERVFYDEISGQYRIRTDIFWALADRYKSHTIGDKIAWRAANQYPGGECEGFIGCVSGRSQMMEGEYLKRYPKGVYVNEALKAVNEVLAYMVKEWKNPDQDTRDTDLKEWQRLLKPLPNTALANTARGYVKELMR